MEQLTWRTNPFGPLPKPYPEDTDLALMQKKLYCEEGLTAKPFANEYEDDYDYGDDMHEDVYDVHYEEYEDNYDYEYDEILNDKYWYEYEYEYEFSDAVEVDYGFGYYDEGFENMGENTHETDRGKDDRSLGIGESIATKTSSPAKKKETWSIWREKVNGADEIEDLNLNEREKSLLLKGLYFRAMSRLKIF